MMNTLEVGARNLSRRGFIKSAALAAGALGISPLGFSAWAQSGSLRVYANSSYRNGYQPAVQRFMQQFPSVNVRAEFAATDQIQTTTRVQLTSRTAPDIITVWPGNGNPLAVQQIAPAGFLQDLSDQPFTKSVPKAFHDVYLSNGKPYFFAPFISMIGAFTNLRVMEELKLSQPNTWSEFLDFCQKVKDAGKVPIALGNGTPWVTQLINYALVPTTAYKKNPRFAEDMLEGKATFAGSDGWRDAMTKYLELNRRGFFNPNPNGTSYEEALQMVASGKAAMSILTSPSALALLNFAGHRDFEVWPIPGNDNPEDTQIPMSLANGLGVNAATRNKEAALAFLNFLSQPKELQELGRVLETPVLAEGIEPSPLFAKMMPYVADKGVLFMDNKWPNARVQQTHFSGVQEMLNGSATPEDVLRRMDQAFQAR
jgi:raffinose/stachyose/melibiose transport system substrate-binding protein